MLTKQSLLRRPRMNAVLSAPPSWRDRALALLGARAKPLARAFSPQLAFSRSVAAQMAAEQPDLYVAAASEARRVNRIFIDWLRNARGATSIANWSLRAREGAPAAVPLRWDELEATTSGGDYDRAPPESARHAWRRRPGRVSPGCVRRCPDPALGGSSYVSQTRHRDGSSGSPRGGRSLDGS